MSTSLLCHGFGARGCHHLSTRYEGGAVISTICQNPAELSCAFCGASRLGTKGEISCSSTNSVRFWRMNLVLAINRYS